MLGVLRYEYWIRADICAEKLIQTKPAGIVCRTKHLQKPSQLLMTELPERFLSAITLNIIV